MKYKHSAQFIKKWLDRHNINLLDVMYRFKFDTANDVFFLLARFTAKDYKRWFL